MPAVDFSRAPLLTIAIGPWKPAPHDPDDVFAGLPEAQRFDRRLADALPAEHVRVQGPRRLITPDGAEQLLAVLEAAGRDREWAIGLLVGRPSNPDFSALRLLDRGAKRPWGLAAAAFVDGSPARDEAAAIEALLALQLSLLRARRETAWIAIEAKRRAGSAVAAARVLGIRHQSVTEQLRQASLRATDGTERALSALLQLCGPPIVG